MWHTLEKKGTKRGHYTKFTLIPEALITKGEGLHYKTMLIQWDLLKGGKVKKADDNTPAARCRLSVHGIITHTTRGGL